MLTKDFLTLGTLRIQTHLYVFVCSDSRQPFNLRYRYSYLIFWWIEAVYASRDHDEARTREAISRARAPSSMELYLFLQAFLHCAPLAIINILDMMARYANPAFDKSTCYACLYIYNCWVLYYYYMFRLILNLHLHNLIGIIIN